MSSTNLFIKYLFIFLFVFLIFSCETTTKPIIYNKETAIIDKESELIQILLRNNNLVEAENQINKNLTLYPENPDILLLKGWLLLQQDKLDDSEKVFLKLIEKNKKNPLALNGLARVERRKGNFKDASKYISDGLNYLPTNSYLWLEKGIMEYEGKDFKKAYIDFTKAYVLDGNNYDAYFFKYITLLKLNKNIDETKQYWEFLMKKKPLKSWYFQYHADELYSLKLKEYALTIVKQGLDSFPNDPYLLNMNAYYLYNSYLTKQDEELLPAAKKSILKCIEVTKDLRPEFIDTYFLILEKNNETELLKKEFEKYKFLFPASDIISGWGEKIKK
jgi:tetratricopeptide (TPR) repeat protein